MSKCKIWVKDQVLGVITLPSNLKEAPSVVPFHDEEIPVYSLEKLLDFDEKTSSGPQEIIVLAGSDENGQGGHPIDLCRYQVANCYMGRAGLINSGGASGENDFADAARTAVVNKRAGGMGLISGRKAFQRPMAEGVKLLNLIQDVYLCKDVTIA